MWHKVSTSGGYAITDGRHFIAKLLSKAKPGYLLWLDGKLVSVCFKTADEAKVYALRHEHVPPPVEKESATL